MKRLTASIAICLLAWGSGARSESPASGIYLDSNLSETHLDVRGPSRIAGSSPLSIVDLPVGEYGLTVDGPGLAQARGRFLRTQVGITPRAWTGPAALLFPPGLVHTTRGEKRGWLFLGMGMTSGAMSAIGSARLDDAENDRARAAATYASVMSEREIRDARIALEGAERKTDDLKEVRALWLGAFAYTWVAAGVEGLFLTPQPTFTPSPDGKVMLSIPRADGHKAAIRSALIPGAGQRFMGRNGKAAFFTSATAILAIASIATHEDFLDARRGQAEAQSRFLSAETDEDLRVTRKKLQEAADDTSEKNLIQWSVIGALGGVYLWNVLDAYETGRQAAGASSLSIGAGTGSDGDLRVGASWSFQ